MYRDKATQARYRQAVREYCPTHSNSEVAALTGIPEATISRIRRELGIAHTPETLERLKRKIVAATTASRTREVYARSSEAHKRMFRREYWRQMQGLPQATGARLRTRTKREIYAISNLCIRRGYKREGDGSETLLYDDSTRRALPGLPGVRKTEEYYTKKLRIQFRSADGTV